MKKLRYLALITFGLSLGACDTSPSTNETQPTTQGESAALVTGDSGAAQVMTSRRMQMWTRSCALCHITGNGGAPRIGNADEWTPRLAQGLDLLLQHTVEGLNDMPPLGYCMACERGDFVAMIELMTDGIAAPVEGASP